VLAQDPKLLERHRESLSARVNQPETVSGFHQYYGDHYYLRYRVYRSFISQYDGTLPTRTLFYDEVRIGQTRQEAIVDEAQPVH
jgi:hypothetical protein